MSAILKQNAVDIANAFEKYGLWKGGGSGGSINAEIKELWSGQQSFSSELTLLDDYANYDIIISMIEPLEDYPTQQKFDFMLKGEKSLTGGMAENSSYITSYRLNNWNGTSVYFNRDSNPSGWNVTLRKIWGIKFVSQIHEYSTEEKVVGKWIDGRKIYEITYYNKNPVKSSYYNEYVNTNLTIDADIFIEISGTVKREVNNGIIYPISYEDSNYKFHVRPTKTDNGYIINYCCFFSSENISDMIITLKYVKNE